MVEVDITDLKENPDNPREIGRDKMKQLVQSLKDFPEMLKLRPIVVDSDNVVLGGNMRLKALRKLKKKKAWVVRADDLTEEQKQEFIIKDNVGFGEWQWNELHMNWDIPKLKAWGLEVINPDDYGTKFDLPDGDKGELEQITFTLHSKQASVVRDALKKIKGTAEYATMQTHGNTNSNGNALYLLINSGQG